MTLNRVKTKLKAGEATVGSWLRFASPAIAEMMAGIGMDWLVIDTDHGPAGWENVEDMIRAMNATQVVPLVRVPLGDRSAIHRALDRGALGVVVPMVNTADEAQDVVKASRYRPLGTRPISLNRLNWHGSMFVDHVEQWSENVLVVCLIETHQGVKNVDAIAAVDGVDVLFVGKNDLSADLGQFRGLETAAYREAVQHVLWAGRAGGKAVGYMTASADEALTRIREGFQFVAAGSDGRLLYRAAITMYDDIRKGLAR